MALDLTICPESTGKLKVHNHKLDVVHYSIPTKEISGAEDIFDAGFDIAMEWIGMILNELPGE